MISIGSVTERANGARHERSRTIDGAATLVAPVAIRVIDLNAPLKDLTIEPAPNPPNYRSLLAVGRQDGYPPVIVTFSLGRDGQLSRDRLAAGLRRQLEQACRETSPHPTQRGSRAPAGWDRNASVIQAGTAARPAVSVVIPTCGNPASLRRCLRSLLRCDYGNFEVIVVANGPRSSATERMLARHFVGESRLRYVEEMRRGASRARNAGLAQVEGELVAFIDDDVVVDPSWIRCSVDALKPAADIGCVTSLILPLKLETDSQLLMQQFAAFGKGLRRATYRLPESRDDNPLLPYAAGAFGSGAGMLMRSEVARELGGFDEALGPATPTTGGEDLDLFIRVLRAGYAISYEPSAIVWHEHPNGMERLRRQVYRYGVGLGATLAKQVVAGPQRRDLLRAVPAGLRYLRNPQSRKNADKPNDYPRRLTRLERLGMLVGPLAYLLSAVMNFGRQFAGLRRRAEIPAIRSWRRVVLANGQRIRLVWFEQRRAATLRPSSALKITLADASSTLVHTAMALSVLAPLAVALGLPPPVRAAAVFGFLCVAPGTAFLSAARGRIEIGLTAGLSLGITAVCAQAMLWLHAWWPRPVLYGASAVCFAVLVGSQTGVTGREGGVPLRIVADGPRELIRRIPPDVAFHAAIILIALVAWALSLRATDLAKMGGIGLLEALPPSYFVAFGLLLVGFTQAAAVKHTDARLLGVYVLALVVVLHATTALLYSEPRYGWTYKHLGVINLVATTGHANRQIDIYNNWPAFFAANAWWSKTAGIGAITYAGWAQVFFNVLDVFAARFALRGVTRDERLLWIATFFFVLGNWVAQDYLAPQAFGFSLSLIVLGLVIRCGRRRSDEERPLPLGSAAALIAGAICFLAIVTTHQLSPVLLILGVVSLAVFVRRVPLWVPAAMIAVEAWWVALGWPFLTAHFKLIDLAPAGSGAAGRNLASALPGAALSFYAPAAVMLLIVAFALAGLARRWRAGARDLIPICLIVAPTVGALAQSYGGEGAYRAYLFALPWLSFLAAGAVARGSAVAPGLRVGRTRMLIAASLLSVCLLLAYFGQELANHVSKDDVLAQAWYERHAPAGAVRINLAPTAPARLTARYPLVSLSDPSSILEQPGFAGHELGQRDVARLEALMRQQGAHPVYVILSTDQENFGRFNGLLPGGSAAQLAQAMSASGSFRLVYRRATAWVFQYAPPDTAPANAHLTSQRAA